LDTHGEPSREVESKEPSTPESMRELYYTYLSMLLDPMEGHDTARHDSELVEVSYAAQLLCRT
jgi:hypothetical protein